MRFDEADFLAKAYGDAQGLSVRTQTHRRYGIQPHDIFATITSEAARRRHPAAVLDIGAGTGSWYHAVRRLLGPSVRYVGLDRSEGMVARLEAEVGGDPNAQALLGDAQSLPWPDGSFDWAGLHFMLYHVPDIRLALAEAWRVLRPEGLLLATTTTERPYKALFDLMAQSLTSLGYRIGEIASPAMRFSLENGANFTPAPPELLSFPAGFRFDAVEPALLFLSSGPIDAALDQAGASTSLRERVLTEVGKRIDMVITRDGSFLAASRSGFFVVRKCERSEV